MTERHEELLLRFARIVAAEGRGRGLQPVQWQTLTYLRTANRFSRTAKALTAWLGQTKGSVSQTIITLEQKGLLTRRQDLDDQRVIRLELTDAGCAMLDAPPPSMSTSMLSHLSGAERDAFMALITKMLVATIERQGGRPFGQCRTCRHFEAMAEPDAYRCALLEVPLSDEDSRHICYEQVAA